MVRNKVLIVLAIFASVSAAPLQTVTPIGPNDAIGFDYSVTEFVSADVLRFEGSWDGAGWTNLGVPPIVSQGAPVGYNTYRVIPPFVSGQHNVVFRACNALGCGGSSVPFAFAWSSGVSGIPRNVRRIPRF